MKYFIYISLHNEQKQNKKQHSMGLRNQVSKRQPISMPVDEIWDHQHTSDRTVESVCFRAWSDCTSNNCLKHLSPCFLLNV